MTATAKQGRPRASSRATLAEAAVELFLEQGYEATSVSEITARAGVSRSSFFNYFGSKHDVLWSGVDDRVRALESSLSTAQAARESDVVGLLRGFADGLAPDSIALAFAHAEAMGISDDLRRESAARAGRIADAVASTLRESGVAPLPARVRGAAYGHAVIAAVEQWALDGPGHAPLAARLDEALRVVASFPPIT